MDCVNHIGESATAYCQSCGKALCAGCVRNAAGGQLLCEPCWLTWQSYQQPFVTPPASGPNPSAAAVLGLIPGVGAMYNGQFFKGFIHVIVFAVLISITSSVNGIFGIFIGAWVLYQSFEAYHTAKALRDGQPPPDPLGLNEVGNWLNLGAKPQYPGQPGAGPAQPAPGPTGHGQAAGGYPPPYAGQYQPPYGQSPYQAPYPPPAGFVDPAMPPIPPMPPVCWRRREPVGAIVLIALGLLFLLGQMNIFNGRLMEYTWPLLLIGLGVWLIVRRLGESHGGSK
jgi:TM2 domain-containing membrane protein YozV